MLKQKTLKDSFSLSGKGLHTGLELTVTFNPAPDNHGYKIQRVDMEGQPIIDAVADNVVETTRGTVLAKGDARVSTIEHGMAALYALGIDNCLIQVNGPEFPILDGSAQYYVQEIDRVGIEEQNAVKDFYIIKSKIEFRDETTGSSIIVLPISFAPKNKAVWPICEPCVTHELWMFLTLSRYSLESAKIRKYLFGEAFCTVGISFFSGVLSG